MARCRCAEDACVCQLRAGAGISLQGVGSVTDPWVVSAPPAATGAIFVEDTPSVDATTTGTGSQLDPYIVQLHAQLDPLLDLLDSPNVRITATGAGTEASPMVLSADLLRIVTTGGSPGDVLTQGADGVYRPGPPALIPPGAITTGLGLVGDGSSGSPLRVDLCTYGDLKALCATP